MKVSEFKKIIDALARFADVRAKPDDVKSRVGVQVSKEGILTLIASNDYGGMLVRLDDARVIPGPYGYYIEAKPLLQAAKVLKGKIELTFDVTPELFSIITSEGGKVSCRAKGSLKEAGFLPKPKGFVAKAIVYAEKWEQLSKMEPTITKGEGYNIPTIELVGNHAHIVMTGGPSKHSYASLMLEGEGEDGARAAIQHDLIEAFKALGDDGQIEWGPNGLLASTGRYECWSAPYKVSAWDGERQVPHPPSDPPAWPILRIEGDLTVSFDIDRMGFLDTLRGLAASDEYGRFTMEVLKTGKVNVTPFGAETGFTLPVKTNGNAGSRSASAEYMSRLVRGMTGKTITIGWMGDQPAIVLKTPEMSGWTILQAPVALS